MSPTSLVRRDGAGSGLGLGLEKVFVFDSKSENRDRAVEAVELFVFLTMHVNHATWSCIPCMSLALYFGISIPLGDVPISFNIVGVSFTFYCY